MPSYKRLFGILCSTLLGAIFVYSAFTKLWPVIETFEFSFIDLHVGNWYTAPVLARLVIGLELLTGMLLLACFELRRFTLRLTIGMLIFFTVYLVMQLTISGNTGNCGCFGEHHFLTPAQGIIKNAVMVALAVAAFLLYPGWSIMSRWKFMLPIAVVSMTTPFVVNPIDYTYSSNNLDEKVNYPLDLDLLYHPDDSSEVQVPSVDLRKGKHVLAFLSLKCPNCRIAAKKFRLIKLRNPELPIYFVLSGNTINYREFIRDTRAANIPSSFAFGKPFTRLAAPGLPRIYYLDEGVVVKKVDYFELSQENIEGWINQPSK